jgi:hypothetical protein
MLTFMGGDVREGARAIRERRPAQITGQEPPPD